jgi:hypothetical protein
MEERHMPTNRENKPNGSAAKTGNGAARSDAEIAANSGANGVTASGVLGGVKQRVTSRVDEQKNRAADGLGGIADVFRTASNELRNENETLASYVDSASEQMKRFADQIRQKGVADMLDDVHAFARRRPALFIGGAFLIGIGIARFLKASSDRGAMRSYKISGFSDVDPMTAGTGSPSYSGDLGEAGSY